MGIALTDDHRELSGVARAFLTSQKVRWAARASLDAAGDARPPFWQNLAGWAGSACISTSDTVALAMACPSLWW
ncbi:acyl-CoA dehydrogenase [Mycobacterium tuberculosis]|nr:acyl-CoA dehydrogenase [Mycobacterium tuberculosis]CMO91843.1 acyl-CoA dehydrogenase [Mycobacterium tuberculosis]